VSTLRVVLAMNKLYPYLLGLAMALEVSAYPKPGNVHRLRCFREISFEDFIVASHISIKWFLKAYRRGFRGWGNCVFGDLILGCVRDVYSLTGVNTSLGTLTLLIPLSISTGYCTRMDLNDPSCFTTSVGDLLEKTTVYDTIYYYRAVRLVKPSHIKPLENRHQVDVYSRRYVKELLDRNLRLIEVLKYSSRYELVHQELLNRFEISSGASIFLRERLVNHGDWNRAVVETYLYILSKHIDTLVARKHGLDKALYVKTRASHTLDKVLNMDNSSWVKPVMELDEELGMENINPGSVADITSSTIALYLLWRYASNSSNILEKNY